MRFVAVGLVAIPALLAAQSPAAPSWEQTLDSTITAELARTKTPGVSVAIAHEGKVIYAKAFGVADVETQRAATPQTLFRVGSVTKMVTGAVLAELSVAGKLDLKAPIGRYVKELEGRRVANVTAHQLLTHSAGWLDNAIPYGRMGEGALGEVMREVTDTLFFTEPGRVLSYSNPGFSMAGYVAEQAAGGKRFGDLADEFVLRKMGMPHATFRPLRALTHDFSHGHVGQPGNPGAIVRPFTENTAQWAAGFLMASAQDMARFAIALMDNGMLDGRRVLSEDAVKLVTTGYQPVPGDSVARYGYGLMIGKRHTDDPVWQHGGSINGFDAQVMMYPRQRIALVVLDNRSGAPLTGISPVVIREVAKLPLAPETEAPAERVANARERAQLAGRYVQNRVRVEIVERGDSLYLRQATAEVPVRLVGDDRIVMTPPTGNKITMLLVRDESGRVAYLSQGLRALARQP